jgi:hypothetical protein
LNTPTHEYNLPTLFFSWLYIIIYISSL